MDSTEINFFSDGTDFVYADAELARRMIDLVLRGEKTQIAEVNIVFCGAEEIRRINREFLNKDRTTDVITFNLEGDDAMAEIYIGIDQVEENSKYFNETFENEINRVLIHGALHISGYKDYTEVEKKMMREKENFYLKKIS